MPKNLSRSTTSRQFQPISESEGENESENVQLSITRTMARHTHLPESEREPPRLVAQRAPVASTTLEVAEIAVPRVVSLTTVPVTPANSTEPCSSAIENVDDTAKSTDTKKHGRKQLLVPYCSQDSNDGQETPTSQKNGRKQTAVRKMGG